MTSLSSSSSSLSVSNLIQYGLALDVGYYIGKRILSGHQEEHHKDEHVDILVSGFGLAGYTSAMQAIESMKDEKNKSVLLVDRMNGGGASERSAGLIYLGGGTDLQKSKGFQDTPLDMYEYLKLETEGAVSDELLMRFCQQSPSTAAWLRDYCKIPINLKDGDPLQGEFCHFKTSNPQFKYSLFYSGSETAAPYRFKSKPSPRGHKVCGYSGGESSLVGTGNVMFQNIRARVKEMESKGLRVSLYTKVTELLWDKSKERVIGVKLLTVMNAPLIIRYLYMFFCWFGSSTILATPFPYLIDGMVRRILYLIEDLFGETRNVFAKRGVILASGGFGRNQELLKLHAPKYQGLNPIGSIGDDGYGIFELGVKQAQAQTELISHGSCWKFICPPQAFPKGVLVGLSGKRLVNEDVYGARLGHHVIFANEERQGWLIIDQKLVDEVLNELYHGGDMLIFQQAFTFINVYFNRYKANSLKELAKACGIHEKTFQDTIRDYNEYCKKGQDDEFGKIPEKLSALVHPPYYAINIACQSTNPFLSPSFTTGGLKVLEDSGEVISAKTGSPIPGLYAAGRTAAGVCSKFYVSGLSLGDCIFSGRRAGMHAAVGEYFGGRNEDQILPFLSNNNNNN